MPGTPEYDANGAEYWEYMVEQIPIIGNVGMTPQPVIVSDRITNFPQENLWWGPGLNFTRLYRAPQWSKAALRY